MLQITSGETASPHNNKILNQIKGIAGDVFNKLNSPNSHLFFNNRIVFPQKEEIFKVLAELRVDENHLHAKNLLIQHVYKCEQQCAGSSYVLLSLLANSNVKFLNCGILDKNIVARIVKDANIEILSTSLFKAFELAGPNCTISINKNVKESYVHIKDSLEFPISQVKEFGESVELNDCRLFVYDGIIETVSQIDRIINECFNSKSCGLIFARGFGYEVISTLLHNYRLGKIKIIPVAAKTDWIYEFLIKDLADCAGIDSSSIKNYATIKNIKISNSFITIFDESLNKNINSLFIKIAKDLRELKIDNEIIKERLKILSSKKIEIGIGNEFANCKDVVCDRIDYLNRVIIRSKLLGYSNIKINNKEHILPIDSLKIARRTLESMKNTLRNTKLVKLVE